jgi:hypothetical protein
MYSMPFTVGGIMPFSSVGFAFLAPRIRWVDGLVKSKSKRPTLRFFLARVKASVVAMRLLPTPPFPLETAIISFIFFSLSFIMLVLGSIMPHFTPFMFSSQIPRPLVISKSGLLHFGHLMYACATSGMKCMASVVFLSSLWFWNSHVFPHARHLSCVFACVMRNFVFLRLAGLSCERANRNMSGSICWSSPIFMVTSVTCLSPSFSAICTVVAITASAKAHSCMKKHTALASIKHIAPLAWIVVGCVWRFQHVFG